MNTWGGTKTRPTAESERAVLEAIRDCIQINAQTLGVTILPGYLLTELGVAFSDSFGVPLPWDGRMASMVVMASAGSTCTVGLTSGGVAVGSALGLSNSRVNSMVASVGAVIPKGSILGVKLLSGSALTGVRVMATVVRA